MTKYNKFIQELIELIINENKNISKFKLYSFLFLLSFQLEKEFKENKIDVEEFRRDMLKKMEELLKN